MTFGMRSKSTYNVLHTRFYTLECWIFTPSPHLLECTHLERCSDVCSKLFHISQLSLNHFRCPVENTSWNISGYLSLYKRKTLHHHLCIFHWCILYNYIIESEAHRFQSSVKFLGVCKGLGCTTLQVVR